jgi:predicted NBD/HSP70 family sugar kinase
MATMTTTRRRRSAERRWRTAGELLRLVHAEPGVTRSRAGERLGLSSGATTELVERLRDARLLAESPAPRTGPGRPTRVLGAHPDGPLVGVVDLQSAGWRVLTADLDGRLTEEEAGLTAKAEAPGHYLPTVAEAVTHAVAHHQGRVRVIVAVVAGPVSGTRVLQFATGGWDETDLAVLTAGLPGDAGVRLVVGNDATLGGLAEARTGAARGVGVAVHVLVLHGLGGVLLDGGRAVTGARGASGEYGHLPFGDPALLCPCGARGCWGLMVDGRALARDLGRPEPEDPVVFAEELLRDVQDGRPVPGAREAVDRAARALGSGVGSLVNVYDPDIVTLAGLASELRAAAPAVFDDGLSGALMAFRRDNPPEVRASQHAHDGPVRGAVVLGVDELSRPEALEAWSMAASAPAVAAPAGVGPVGAATGV